MEKQHNPDGREINLKSLMIRILLRWKSILLVALVCCIAGSAYKYISLKKAESAAVPESVPAETQDTFGDVEYYREQLNSIDKTIADRKEYLYHSLLRNVDPYNTGMSNESLLIRKKSSEENSQPDAAAAAAEMFDSNIELILGELTNFIKTGIDWTAYREEYGLNDGYYSELVKTETMSNGMTVKAYFQDEAGAEKLRDYVVAQLYSEFSNILEKGGFADYELVSLGWNTSTVVYDTLVGWMSKQLSEIEKLETTRKNIQSDLNAAETVSSIKDDSGDSFSWKTVFKTGIKAGVLGLAGMIGLILLRLIYGDKVLSGKEFNEYYGFRSIINLPGERKDSAEKRIMRMEKENRTEMPKDSRYELAAENIREYAPDVQRIGIIGDADPELLNEIRNDLTKAEGNKEYVILNDINNNLDDRKAMMNVGGVIMVAEAEKTKYVNVDDLLSTVRNYQIPVIGTIIKN